MDFNQVLNTFELWQYACVSIFAFSAVFLYSKLSRPSKLTHNKPPGPKGLPLIGNLHQLSLPAHKAFLRFAEQYGHVFSLRLGSVNTVVISSHESASEFFRSNDLAFASRPPTTLGKYLTYDYNGIGMSPYTSRWRQSRKLCTMQLLTTKRVQSFAHVRREEVDFMVGRLRIGSKQGTQAVNLTHAFEVLATNIIWRITCGKKMEGDEEISKGTSFKDLLSEVSNASAQFNIGDFIPWLDWMDIQRVRRRINRAHAMFDLFAEKLVSGRIIKREDDTYIGDDFLDTLLDQGFPMDRTKALVLEMTSAGTETIFTTLGWTMSLVLKYPQVLRNVKSEIYKVVGNDGKVEEKHLEKLKYLQCVLKESMRMYPPLPVALPHYSVEDTTLCGYHVPKGSMLFVNIWAINRDQNVFEDADQFKPERFMGEESVDLHGSDLKSIPFGYGRRGCPGISMAISIIMLTFATLVHVFEWTVPGELDMTEAIGVSVPRKNPLFAIPSHRDV